MKKKIILIGGPTAVGKTEVGIKCAQMFNGEIINADSIQIYRHLNIGSAKPTKDEQALIKHHLLDILEPNEEYSVAQFKKDAKSIIENLYQNNKLPIFVGGTGLFLNALLYNYEYGKSWKSSDIREKYNALAKEKGNKFVYDLLTEKDSLSAQKIHFNDTKRVIRALEIFEMSGIKKSAMQLKRDEDFDCLFIFLNADRKTLYSKIDLRVDKMFEMGLKDEVEKLIKNYHLTSANQSMQAIGYKEFFNYFNNEYDLNTLKEKIKQNSRHYAKRQLTWFKHNDIAKEFLITEFEKIAKEIQNFLNS